jgi:hypothetical protein
MVSEGERKTMSFYDLTHRVWRVMYDRGWTKTDMDDTLRSRIVHAVGEWRQWHEWGGPVMWLVGRYDTGSAGVPRGRDLWWIPTEYVEGIENSLVADLEQRFGCYVTTRYADVLATTIGIDWRIYDLQDEGRTVKVALYPNRPEHDGRLQPLPWQDMKVDLFLWWYVWQHKGKAQWFGLRRWVYYKALHASVNRKIPFTCQQVPPPNLGGYSHWHCELKRKHAGDHRFRAYTWGADRVQHSPASPTQRSNTVPGGLQRMS